MLITNVGLSLFRSVAVKVGKTPKTPENAKVCLVRNTVSRKKVIAFSDVKVIKTVGNARGHPITLRELTYLVTPQQELFVML